MMNELLISLMSDIDNCEELFGVEPKMLNSRDISVDFAVEWADKWFPGRDNQDRLTAPILYAKWFRSALTFREWFADIEEWGK